MDDDDARPPSRATWTTIANAVLAATIGTSLIDRYGWIDGLLRLLAITWMLMLAIAVDWRRVRCGPLRERVMLVGNTVASTLYLTGSFVLQEPGPGGTLCVAALVVLGCNVAATVVARRRAGRASASA